MKNNSLLIIAALGLFLILQGQGVLKLDLGKILDLIGVVVDPQPEPKPDPKPVPPVVVPEPPVVVPDPEPPVVPKPDPKPEPVVDDYPKMPSGLQDVSEDIYNSLVKANNARTALVFANNYKVFADSDADFAARIQTTNDFVTFNNDSLKELLKLNNLKSDAAPGLGVAINDIIKVQLTDMPKNLDDNEAIKDIFRAISRQAYSAYLQLSK